MVTEGSTRRRRESKTTCFIGLTAFVGSSEIAEKYLKSPLLYQLSYSFKTPRFLGLLRGERMTTVVADYGDRNGSGVHRVIKRLEEKAKSDRALSRRLLAKNTLSIKS